MTTPLVRQLLGLLNRRERWQATLLLVVMVVQAAFELVGVASIAPFMSVVADPTIIQRNDPLSWLYKAGGFGTTTGFLTALGIGAVLLLALSNGVSAAAQWASIRFVWSTHHRLAVRMLRGYLAQPYGFFVQHNSSRLHKAILSEVGSAVSGVLQPTMTFIARSLVTLAIIGLLIALDPFLALMVSVVLGGAYGVIYLAVRQKQERLGQERVQVNQERYKVASEAFGGIKDVKVLQREDSFVTRFAPASRAYARAMASNASIALIPKYVLETVAFGGVLLIVVFYLQAGAGLGRILPTLSLYALSGYRLMPALQQLFAAAASVRFQRAALDDLLEDLSAFVPASGESSDETPLRLEREIQVEGVTFRYPAAAQPALNGISLTIPRNTSVGLVGASGSGKTTLVDLLLGLYTPDEGRVTVDGVVLDASKLSAWRRQVGYVPQHIFLCDDTIANNIAFGIPASELDPERVEHAARIAHLHDFIRTLPEGYKTAVGERGVRLSGGQRQRIGIARALYHDPEVLVMDEATSALDGATEDAVMEAIRDLSGRKTIILIAHRITTVEECDHIFMLDEGRVVSEGRYEELVYGSAAFRAMARVATA